MAVKRKPITKPAGTEISDEHFIRIVKTKKNASDHFDAFQPEIITVRGNQIIKRQMIDKPNLFEYAYCIAAELIDPRNMERYDHATAPV